MHGRIVDVVADVLHEHDVDVARALLAEAWILLAAEQLDREAARAEHERLLLGLAGHIELLAGMRARAMQVAGTEAGPRAPRTPRTPLTPREQAVLHLMHAGRTAASIGAQLGVSPRTVHKHQEHLYRKLGTRDRLGAVLAGQRSGLLPAPERREEAALGYGSSAAQASTPASRATVSTSKSSSPR